MRPAIGLFVAMLAAAPACSGSIAGRGADEPAGTSGAGASGTRGGAGAGGSVATSCDQAIRGGTPPRIWRLSKTQYTNAVAVVFQGRAVATQRKAVALPAGVQAPFDYVNKDDRFSNMAASYGMSTSELPRVYDAAESLSLALVTALEGQPGSCLAGSGPFDACMKSIVRERGALMFSRPLTDDEVNAYATLATANVNALGKHDAAAAALQAMFAAPQFTFRGELGQQKESDGARLDAYELAAALAYSLTDFPPDEALWEAASKGALAKPNEIAAQIARLAGKLDENAIVARYVREHFRYASAGAVFKDPKKFPFHDAPSLVDDTDRFVAATLRDHGRAGFLSALLTSSSGIARASTAPSYGLDRVAGTTPTAVTFDNPRRAGILMQPSWLVAYSDAELNKPVQRGKFVRTSVVCRDVPALPIGQVRALPESSANLPLRERLEEHRTQPGCAGCHKLMDPLGLPFEQFDHLGRPRTTDMGKPVDASGALADTAAHDGPVRDGFDLVDKLAADAAIGECFVRHNLRFWLGRDEEDGDACALRDVTDAFAAKGNYADLLTTLFTSDAFLRRNPN